MEGVKCPTIGVNQSWRRGESNYHVALHREQYDINPAFYDRMDREGRLFVMGSWPCGVEVRDLHHRWTPFSTDLTMGAVSQKDGIGTVAFVALQLAVWMGFDRIYFLGLDLHGPKFTGEPAGQLDKMLPLFTGARDILKHLCKVYVVGRDSHCTAFPRLELLPEGVYEPRRV